MAMLTVCSLMVTNHVRLGLASNSCRVCLEDDDDSDNDDYDYSYINSYFDDFKPVGSTERFLSLRQLSGRPWVAL